MKLQKILPSIDLNRPSYEKTQQQIETAKELIELVKKYIKDN